MHCHVFSVAFGSWYDHVTGWWKKKQIYSNLHYMFYEDMIEVCLKLTGCWSLPTTLAEPLVCPGLRFCRTLTARWTNSATFWTCPPPPRRRGKSYLMHSLTIWKRTTWSTTPKSLQWTSTFLPLCGKVTWSWHRMFVKHHKRLIRFLSAGKVADWRNHFTVAQNEEFDYDYEIKMKDPTLKFRTRL